MKKALMLDLTVFIVVVMIGSVSAVTEFEYGNIIGVEDAFDGTNVFNELVYEKNTEGLWIPIGYMDINITRISPTNVNTNSMSFHQLRGVFVYKKGLIPSNPIKTYKGYVIGTKTIFTNPDGNQWHEYILHVFAYDTPKNDKIEGNLHYNGFLLENGDFDASFFQFDGFLSDSSIEDHESRISSLESWQQTMNDWKETITGIIDNILERVGILEGQEPPPTTPVCGNGVLETGEECDDGNLINDDGCSNQCEIEIIESDFIKFRTSDLFYGSRTAVAFGEECDGSDLKTYGKTNGACLEFKCSDAPYYEIPSNSGTAKLWIRNSDEVCICDEGYSRAIRYSVKDSDNLNVNPSGTIINSNYELSC